MKIKWVLKIGNELFKVHYTTWYGRSRLRYVFRSSTVYEEWSWRDTMKYSGKGVCSLVNWMLRNNVKEFTN